MLKSLIDDVWRQRILCGCILGIYFRILESAQVLPSVILVALFVGAFLAIVTSCSFELERNQIVGVTFAGLKFDIKSCMVTHLIFDFIVLFAVRILGHGDENTLMSMRYSILNLRYIWFFNSTELAGLAALAWSFVYMWSSILFPLGWLVQDGYQMVMALVVLSTLYQNQSTSQDEFYSENTECVSKLESETIPASVPISVPNETAPRKSSDDYIAQLERQVAWSKAMNKIRANGYHNIEHKLGNPAQSLFLILDEICTLKDELIDEISNQISETEAGEQTSTIAEDAPKAAPATNMQSQHAQSVMEKLKEIDGLVDFGLVAIDLFYVARSELNDVVLCEQLESEQPSLQPTNLHWIADRCQYALSNSSDTELVRSTNGSDDGTVTLFSIGPEVSFESHVDFNIKTCLLDDRWVFSMLAVFLASANRNTKQGEIHLDIALVERLSEATGLLEDYVRFQVSDTGAPLEERGVDESKLFQFDPWVSTSAEFSLYQVRRRIEAMDGTCGYQPNTTAGHGCVFWVEMPYKKTNVEAKSTQAPMRMMRPGRSINRQRKRLVTMLTLPEFTKHKDILIIDDEIIQRTLLAKHLKSKGYVVEHAADGVEGLHKMQLKEYLVVLCDRVMPRMSGIECIREYRSWETAHNRKRQFIVGLSANRDKFDADIDMALNKPIRPADICELLELKLQRKAGLAGMPLMEEGTE